jgi:guanylate kinase
VVLEIEVQGARQVRRAMPEAVQVFIAPPSLEALRTRLITRATDEPEEVERRLRVAEGELAAQPEFAHVIVNDSLPEALEQLSAIVAHKLGSRADGGDGDTDPSAPGAGAPATTLHGERRKAAKP